MTRINKGQRHLIWAIGGALTWTLAVSLLQANAQDPFSKTNEARASVPTAAVPGDPFSPANKAGASRSAAGQAVSASNPDLVEALRNLTDEVKKLRDEMQRGIKKPERSASPGPDTSVASLINFKLEAIPPTVRPGQVVRLTITGTPKAGYHTYTLTQRTQEQQGRLLTKLTYELPPGVKPLWPIRESTPQREYDKAFGFLLEHKKPFTWSQDFLVLPDATTGSKLLKVSVDLQVCNEQKCTPGILEYQIPIEVSGEPVKLTAELEQRLREPRPEPTLITTTGDPGGDGNSMTAGLLSFVLTGIFWGFVSLLTPCVFPMIPITVSYFLKQSEKEHHRPITMALVYCATIIVVLTIAAVALLSFFRGLSVNPALNFVIGGLFIFFALSLFGMYEIELPSGLARFTSAREGKGGLAGTMFMALTFTIISFACVAPFLGGFGGTAANSGLTFWHRLLGGLAFAVTFASPFFILALFPVLLKKLPKSGSWLNTVKVVMGFLEMAAAFKFLRAAELVLLPHPVIFTYDFVLGLYVALSVLCGLYLLGVFRLPHDTPAEHLGVPRLLFSVVFLGLGLYLAPGLFKSENGQNQRPTGEIFAWLDSFLLPDEVETDLPWVGNLAKGIETAKKQGQLVFVDFTGVTCTNCRLNERNVFSRAAVKDLLKHYALVSLYTDKVPERLYPPEVQADFGSDTTRQREDAAANLQFQRQQFNTEQLPLYVILEPQADGGFREVARYDEGRIIDQAAFIRFLQRPLDNGSAKLAQGPAGGT
jgi:thiol:disulfide interchange protein DsbD